MSDHNSTEGTSQPTPTASEPVESVETSTTSTGTEALSTPSSLYDSVVSESEAPTSETSEPEKPAETAEAKPKTDTETEAKTERSLEEQAIEEALNGKIDDAILDAQNPEDMANAQRNATAKAYLQRLEKRAAPMKDFHLPDKETGEFAPIAKVAEKLKDMNEERYAELTQYTAHSLVDTNPDAAFRRIYAVKMMRQDPNWNPQTAEYPKFEDFISQSQTAAATPTQRPEVPANLAELTSGLEDEFGFDWRDPKNDDRFVDDFEKNVAIALRSFEADASAKTTENTELKQQLEDLAKQIESYQQAELTDSQKDLQADLYKENDTFRSSIADVLKPQLLRKAGLEPSKDDNRTIAEFKANKAKLFEGNGDQDSPFETFAYEESSVKAQIEMVAKRIVDCHLKAVHADKAGKKADAEKYRSMAADERIPMSQLMAQAGKEFIEKHLAPDLNLIRELSGGLAAPIKEAAQRPEITGNGTGVQPPRAREFTKVADLYDSIVADAQEDSRLRAA